MDARSPDPDSQKRRKALSGKSDAPMQLRAVQTRKELLKSARFIFARDGFEAAKLQDIAKNAGKTRGALYAHFQDKEDLFFALIQEDLREDSVFYRKNLKADSSREERIAVLTQNLERLIHDRQRALLYIEFKLYAARHPHNQSKLAELHVAMCFQGSASKLELVPELATSTSTERRRLAASFGALLDGLSLNHYFDPLGLTDEQIHAKVEQLVRQHFKASHRLSRSR